MKKVLFVIVLLFAFVVANAQVASTTVNIPNTFGKIESPTTVSTMYKITNTTAGYVLFVAPMNNGSKQDFVVKLDSVSGNHTNVAVEVYGQKSALKNDWNKIGGTTNWKGTTADTTMVISNTSYVYYQNFKIVFTGTGTGVTKLTSNSLKLWLE